MAEYKINYTQSNFTGGLIAAELYGRNDFNKVKSGMKKCTNWTVREAGGLEFRRGTKYVNTLPVDAGVNFKLESIDDVVLVFCSTKIYYLKPDNSWGSMDYPTGVIPDIDNIQFAELKQRLYYYDGTMKLCAVYLDENHTPYTEVETFEYKLQDASVNISVVGNPPSPTVQIPYTYSFSIATDENHESLSVVSNTVEANAELGPGSTSDPLSQRIDVDITISSADTQNKGKIFIYKKYQGKFYFLTSIDIEKDKTTYTYNDNGTLQIDVSKTEKEMPYYLAADGSISYVQSIADYGQRIFLTLSSLGTNVVFSQVGNTDSLAYSELRNADEAGYLEVPISHYDSWCKVVAGLDLIFSTSYTVSKISGYGDLQLDTIIWDGLSKTVQPVRTKRSLIYTNTNNRNIYDLTYNEYGQYDSIDLTLLVKYIFERKTIKKLAFKDYPIKTVYVLCDDGDLYCLTYIKDQNIYAWYKIEHFGKVVDIQVVNLDTEDKIYIAIQDGDKFLIEEAYAKTEDVYMDCIQRIRLSDITDNVITGLEVYEGKKIRVFDLGNNLYYGDYDIYNPKTVVEGGKVVEIDDLDFDGYLVENGQITLPESVVLTGDVLVGVPYYAVMETIPLEFSDNNGNSTIGRKKTINEAYLRYGDSRGLTYKTIGREYDCRICEKDVADNAQFLERGQIRLDVKGDYKWDSTIKILQRQPYPARIESITLGLHFNDKS